MATVKTLIGNIKGKDGATPYIGANKNWFINGVDQGICAEGSGGLSDVPKLYLPYVPQECYVDENFVGRAGAHINLSSEYIMRNPTFYNSSSNFGLGRVGVAVGYHYNYVSESSFETGYTIATFEGVDVKDLVPSTINGSRGDWLKIKCEYIGIEGNQLRIGVHFNDYLQASELNVTLPISNAYGIDRGSTYLFFEDMTDCALIPGAHKAYKECSIVPYAYNTDYAYASDKANSARALNLPENPSVSSALTAGIYLVEITKIVQGIHEKSTVPLIIRNGGGYNQSGASSFMYNAPNDLTNNASPIFVRAWNNTNNPMTYYLKLYYTKNGYDSIVDAPSDYVITNVYKLASF